MRCLMLGWRCKGTSLTASTVCLTCEYDSRLQLIIDAPRHRLFVNVRQRSQRRVDNHVPPEQMCTDVPDR